MKLPLQFHIQALSAHGEYRSAHRFKGQLSISREVPFGISCVFGQFLPHLAYGIQKFSFQGFWVVSHRRNLRFFPFCQVFFVAFFNYLQIFANADQTALRTVWSVAYLNEIKTKPEVLT